MSAPDSPERTHTYIIHAACPGRGPWRALPGVPVRDLFSWGIGPCFEETLEHGPCQTPRDVSFTGTSFLES